MMKHYCKSYVFYRFLASSFMALLVIFSFCGEFIESSFEAIFYVLFGYLGFLFLNLIYSFVYYKLTYYELQESEIVLKRGVFIRRVLRVSYKNIHAIDYSQSIIQRIFQIKVLKIDSGATINSAIPEIVIFQNPNNMAAIEQEIRSKMGEEHANEEVRVVQQPEESLYFYDSVKKLLYSLIQSLLMLLVITLLGIGASFAIALSGEMGIIPLIIGIMLALLLITYVVIFLYEIITNYDYRVSVNDKYIIINHGLLTKYHNTLPIDKVKGIIVHEGILMRLFGYASVKIEVVGFGNDNNKTAGLLFPFIKSCEINDYLARVLPEFKVVEPKNNPAYFRFFCFIPSVILLPIIFAPFVILVASNMISWAIYALILGMVLYGLVMLILLMEYKNNGYTIYDDKICISNGSLLKRTIILPRKSIIGIEYYDTICRKKKNVSTFIVHYFNNAIKNTERIRILDNSCYDELYRFMKK